MKQLNVIAALMIITECVIAGQTPPSKTKVNPVAQAKLLQEKGEYGEAERVLSALVDSKQVKEASSLNNNPVVEIDGIDIPLASLYQLRAVSWHHLQRPDKALIDFTESYRLDGNPERLYDMGLSLYQKGSYDKAIERFNEYLDSANPNKEYEFYALYNRAACVLEKKQFDKSLQEFKGLLVRFPEQHNKIQSTIEKIKIEKLAWEKRKKQAEELNNPLLEEKPDLLAKAERDPLLKAELLKKHKLYEEAEKILSAIIETAQPVDPASSDENYLIRIPEVDPTRLSYLYFSRAGCWYHIEHFDKALADYTESYRLDANPDRLYDIGYCLYKVGQYEAAILKFDEYLKQASCGKERHFLALYNRTFCILETGKLDEGLRDLKELQKNFPEWGKSAQYVIDQVLAEKEKRKESTKTLE